MPKYHDSGTECRATVRACPLGISEEDHIEAVDKRDFENKLQEKFRETSAEIFLKKDLRNFKYDNKFQTMAAKAIRMSLSELDERDIDGLEEDELVNTVYKNGRCMFLAAYLNKVHGLGKLVQLESNAGYHWMVQLDEDKYLDVDGIHSEKDLRADWTYNGALGDTDVFIIRDRSEKDFEAYGIEEGYFYIQGGIDLDELVAKNIAERLQEGVI